MEINNLIESKIFISSISFFFGIFVYWFYLYIKHLQEKYDFSDELREVVNHYIKNGAINSTQNNALYIKIHYFAFSFSCLSLYLTTNL
ncbi:MAG: hypothetical protein WJU30_00309 [Candidatus Phytoplasma pruni]